MSDPAGVSPEEYRKAVKAMRLAELKILRESLEKEMLLLIEEAGLPAPVQQLKHVKGREYRLDFAWPDYRLGLEVDGGIKSWKPGHASPAGIIRDIEKHNSGILNGWTVLRAHTDMVHDGSAVRLVAAALALLRPRAALSL